MERMTALIADADRASAREISRKLRKLGYKVKTAKGINRRRYHITKRPVDLLVMFSPFFCSGAVDVAESGHIISVSHIGTLPHRLRKTEMMSSFGGEQLLRERYINSKVTVSCIRTGSGWKDDNIESGLHSLNEEDIADRIIKEIAVCTKG